MVASDGETELTCLWNTIKCRMARDRVVNECIWACGVDVIYRVWLLWNESDPSLDQTGRLMHARIEECSAKTTHPIVKNMQMPYWQVQLLPLKIVERFNSRLFQRTKWQNRSLWPRKSMNSSRQVPSWNHLSTDISIKCKADSFGQTDDCRDINPAIVTLP